MTGVRRWFAAGAAVVLLMTACGGDDDDAGSDGGVTAANDTAEADTAEADANSGDTGGDASGGGGGGGGTLVLGDETIALDSARCYLQEQDAAAGGGKILFVAQGYGTTAAGEDIIIDVSRYDEDSQFAGDDVNIDIGDVLSGESIGLSSKTEIGTVEVDGSNVSADGLTFTNSEDFSEQPGSFDINC